MSFNPPDTRDEIRDTLYFMGIVNTYRKVDGPKGHAFTFTLWDSGLFINILGPRSIFIGKQRFTDTYTAKLQLMKFYQSSI